MATRAENSYDEAIYKNFKRRLYGQLTGANVSGYAGEGENRPEMGDLIARCSHVADVAAAVNFARENDLRITVRSAAASITGSATVGRGLVIDLSPMRAIQVDPAARTVRVEAGATAGEVDRATQSYGLATPTSHISRTSIAEATLKGGLSWLRRKVGMNVDSLLSAEIVIADGRLLTASQTENADLFWGIREAGGGLGIVTAFTFHLYTIGPEVMFLDVLYPQVLARDVLQAWRAFTATAPEEVSSDALLWQIPLAPLFPAALHGEPVIGLAGIYAGPVEEGIRILQPLRMLGEPLVDLSGPMPYVAAQRAFDPLYPHHRLRCYSQSLYLGGLGDEVIDTMLSWAASRPSPLALMPIHHLGGAISRVAEEATAIAHRHAPYRFSIDMTWIDPGKDTQNIAWTNSFQTALQRFSHSTAVLNAPQENTLITRSLLAAHRRNSERMAALKHKYDPMHLFQRTQTIKAIT